MRLEAPTSIELPFAERFSLDSLEESLVKASATSKAQSEEIHFNLADVRWCDIGGILFLACVLSHLKRRGVPFLLTLPEREGRWDELPVRKVRDFLKRWRFDEALQEAIGEFREVLPARQEC